MKVKPIVCVDFDGVINSYTSGWKGMSDIPDMPVPGAIEALHRLVDDGFNVAIFSSRSKSLIGRWAMKEWMAFHAASYYMEKDREYISSLESEVVGMDIVELDWKGPGYAFVRSLSWPWFKPGALITIDDRAITFDGDWSKITKSMIWKFKPWNKP